MAKIENLLNKLNKEIVLLDGGTGTELQRRGVYTKLPLWSAEALLHSPNTVIDVHLSYILAGAEIIKTNTFRTNWRTLAKAGIGEKDEKLTKLAVDLARVAVAAADVKTEIYIGGSQAPLEDCYSPNLVPSDDVVLSEHRRWSQNLAKAEVDFIFLETFNTIREGKLALTAANETGLPVFISFTGNNQARLLSGETIADAVKAIEPLKPSAILFNCMPPEDITKAISVLKNETKLPFGGYGNGVGQPHNEQGWIFDQSGQAMEIYLNCARQWIKDGARIVGGCCGTNPDFIKAMAKIIK